jgi:hypothetical protein
MSNRCRIAIALIHSVLLAAGAMGAETPSAVLRDAPPVKFPAETDSNSPVHWDGDTFYLFNSIGKPRRSHGPDLFHLGKPTDCPYNNKANGGRWIECTWKAEDGTLYGWYHHEPAGLCPGTTLTAPKIGAVRSKDNGATFEDLGIVMEARPGTLRCDAKNGFFAGGHGDLSRQDRLGPGRCRLALGPLDPLEHALAAVRDSAESHEGQARLAAGRHLRVLMKGQSRWEIVFLGPGEKAEE